MTAGIADRSRAVWLIPSREFQAARLGGRDVPRAVRDKRDAVYRHVADTIEADARKHDAPVLVVDGSRGVDEMARAVAERFAEALAEGPRAETAHDRRGLLRYANEAIVAQVLGYLSSRHTTGDVESFVRAFTCECADPELRRRRRGLGRSLRGRGRRRAGARREPPLTATRRGSPGSCDPTARC